MLLIIVVIVSLVFALLHKNLSIGDKVALIRIEGPILDSKDTIDEIKDYVKDPSIKAIVLRVDSPGGAVAPSQEIYEEVRKAIAKRRLWYLWGLSQHQEDIILHRLQRGSLQIQGHSRGL